MGKEKAVSRQGGAMTLMKIIKEIAAYHYWCRATLAALFLTSSAAVLAQQQPPGVATPPQTPGGTGAAAEATAQTAASLLRRDAPDLYTVQQGDTLWGIAQRFLNDPWRWSELWEANRDVVANPHRLYPGQTLLLDRQSGRLHLTAPLYEKRFPMVRSQAVQAIPTLPLAAIHPFLARPVVVTSQQFEGSGQIVAVDEGRTLAGLFDRVYATGVPPEATQVRLFRPLQPILARDGKRVLAYEARYLGEAEVAARDESNRGALLTITRSVSEIGVGDRLLVPEPEPLINFTPQVPDADFSAQVLTFWNPQPESGPFEVILLDAGETSGLQPGHVVALWRQPPPVAQEQQRPIVLPPRRYGLAMVFLTHAELAYALVLESSDSVRRGDRALAPGVTSAP
jgi:hypothetical protein